METVTSADGTVIAYDRHEGHAGTVILVGGAFSYRKFPKMVELAEALNEQYGLTVLNYDRRGRGDSTDAGGYDVEREIDDIAALVETAGGSAMLFGWSSGAGLALRAAGSGRVLGVTKVVAFEPPFVVDRAGFVPPADLTATLHELVAADRRADTVRYYMTQAMGVPRLFVSVMRFTPSWKNLLATACSTPHDWAVMHDYMRGEPLRTEDWTTVKAQTLVIAGAKSDAVLRKGARAIAAVLPDAEFQEVAKLSHNPNVALLAPAAGEFLSGTAENIA
ncbi:pimeloyl-ACP methyl ester carboxylesterase [Nocardia tenerifensis]|uniref:Pimeloyl-ACP methyl ester carboxylesterase n=1 Tax=Nocardia tenerifensis TaxID=228006 RepID=A0A318K2I7_9NOCA|nr:alpha/beta hydrolase [Nocardia tenerifensis]PXX65259.1 pimeloyl-ACP methyl ester carboxylesterase [Nocardia tenerifensis]